MPTLLRGKFFERGWPLRQTKSSGPKLFPIGLSSGTQSRMRFLRFLAILFGEKFRSCTK